MNDPIVEIIETYDHKFIIDISDHGDVSGPFTRAELSAIFDAIAAWLADPGY